MSWKFRLNAPATFDVHIKYATDKNNRGSIYQLSVAGKTLKGQVQVNVSSAKGNDIYTDDIGLVHVPAGVHELTIEPSEIKGDEVMKLFEIDLVPKK